MCFLKLFKEKRFSQKDSEEYYLKCEGIIMSKCFLCGVKLIDENMTIEHVFLYALGDRLTANEILCKSCNSLLGNIIDAPLANDLKNFVNLTQIKTREKHPTVLVTDADSGDEYLFYPTGNKYVLRHDVVQKKRRGSITNISAKFKSDASAKKFVAKLKTKNPTINSDDFSPVHKDEYKKFNVQIPYHPGSTALAILKMAIEFALICGIDPVAMKDVIDLLHYAAIAIQKNIFSDNNPKFENLGIKSIHPLAPIPSEIDIKPKVTQAKLYTKAGRLYCWISLLGLYSFQVQLTDKNVKVQLTPSVYYSGEANEFYKKYRFHRN